MFSFGNQNKLRIQELENELAQFKDVFRSLYDTMAVIEFNPDGVILTANPLFCQTVGYSVTELSGQHHRIFCEPAFAAVQNMRVSGSFCAGGNHSGVNLNG